MKPSIAQIRLLLALASGSVLKSHRYVDGSKVFQLHPLEGPALTVRRDTVERLVNGGLIDSNKKFPAATYWLTEKGKELAAELSPQSKERSQQSNHPQQE
ncbi:MAG: hypothetical protein HY023_06295 [Chloroflexi bacterium]|nr:hypothetical protein [Chloroflexota bacterium]